MLKNVQAISGVLSTNAALPILDNFLIEGKDDTLRITASDQETTMVVSIKPDALTDSGRIVVPAKLLIDWLKTLSDIPVTFTVNKENFGIHISSGEGEFNVSGYNPDEYPSLPKVTDVKSFILDAKLFRNSHL